MRLSTRVPAVLSSSFSPGLLATLAGPARAASDGVLEGSVRASDGLALPHVRVLVEGPSGPAPGHDRPRGPLPGHRPGHG